MNKRRYFMAALFLCSLTAAFAQFSGSGSGTESDPYKIFYADQLNQVRNYTNQAGVVFKLMNDIDLASWIEANNPGQGWEPIGVESAPFMGVFDGNGKQLTGFSINRTSDYVGFFGYTDGATIKNLTITGDVKGGQYTGAFVGKATSGTLTNLTYNGDVQGGNYTGGITGYGSASNADVNGNVQGGQCTGGITGYGSASSVEVSGSVTGSSYVGGIAGYASGTISNATKQGGTVIGTSDYVGGVAGYAKSGISSATCKGNVSGQNKTGGIVGYTEASINVATSEGDVTGKSCTGGICGSSSPGSFVSCRSTGNKTGTTEVGGICGSATGTSLESCYSYGNVTGQANYVGGVIGKIVTSSSKRINKCLSHGDVSGKNYVGGIIGSSIGGNGEQDQAPTLHEYKTYNKYGSTIYKDDIGNTTTTSFHITNSHAIGNVKGTENYVGGVVGQITSGNKYGVYSSDIHTFKTTRYASYGLISNNQYGYYKDGTLIITGTTETSIAYYTYTIIRVYVSVTDCYFNGEVAGAEKVGGVAGSMSGETLARNYSNAIVSGTTDVGGIVGYVDKGTASDIAFNVKSNMSLNTSISGTSNVGRIYGSKSGAVTFGANGNAAEDNRSLYDTRLVISGVTQELQDNEQNGVNNGAAYFKLKANYVSHGWDFNENWTNQETETYPYKPWQAAPPIITSALVSGDESISGQSIDGGTIYIKIGTRAELNTDCSGTDFTLSGLTPLQSGSPVKLYTKTSGKEASYKSLYTVGYPGSGTEADPWRIYTADDIQGVYKAGYYKQMNDIDLTSWINANSKTAGWVPVGYSGSSAIVYDGDNHTISGLWTNTTENYTGLFSSISNGTIKNLNVVASSKQVKGGSYCGLLIGRLGDGSLSNVTVRGNVQGGSYSGLVSGYKGSGILDHVTAQGNVTGHDYVGGIVGFTDCKLSDLNHEGVITASGSYTGGITGKATKIIQNCDASSIIKSTGANTYVGGLIGYASGEATHCHASCDITMSGSSSCGGGLFGYSQSSITKCVSETTLAATGANNIVGGIVSCNNQALTLCYASGTVSATGTGSNAGGLVGEGRARIEDCYSSANVTGHQYTAALVGYNYSTVNRCYASGDVSSTLYGSGLVGYNDGASAVVTNCVAVGSKVEVSDQTGWGIRVIGGYTNGAPDPDESNYAWSGMQISVNGVPKQIQDNILDGQSLTTEQTKAQESYVALYWDFNEVWGIDEGNGYPYLLALQEEQTPTANKGDLDKNGTVNIADIVLIIDVMSGENNDASMRQIADITGDGDVNIADIIAAIDLMIAQTGGSSPNNAPARMATMERNGDYITARMEGDVMSIGLNNVNDYTAFQMTVTLPEGASISDIVLDEGRCGKHVASVSQLNDRQYLVTAYSLSNKRLNGSAGKLFSLHTERLNGEATISDAIFATPEAIPCLLEGTAVLGTATGIDGIDGQQTSNNVYDLQGRRVANNLSTKGVYIVNGKKVVIK